MVMHRLTVVWNVVLFVSFLISPFSFSHAVQFSAELVITSPGRNFVYDLKVKDNLMRLEKTAGPPNVPSLPVIYNKETGVTQGLMPREHQYVEASEPVKTMIMNPVAGWEFMRRNMTGTPAGTETVEGYPCDVVEYREAGKEAVAYRVWTSGTLDFTVRTIAYATNGNATMALRNIKKSPQDDSLFSIPAGYTRAGPSKRASGSIGQTGKSKTSPAASGNIIFILDASGSMWGQVGGFAKITIARDVLTSLIKELPDNATVGLVAYGHRRKGDCDDVEELILR